MISAISLRSALADRPVSDLHLSEWLRRTESRGRHWPPPPSLSLRTIYGPPPSHLDHSHPPTKAPNHYILLSKKTRPAAQFTRISWPFLPTHGTHTRWYFEEKANGHAFSYSHTKMALACFFLQIDHVHCTVCIDQELLTPDVSILLPYSTSPSEIPPPTDFPKWPNVRAL